MGSSSEDFFFFESVVRPILNYGSIVWWSALSKEYNRIKFKCVDLGTEVFHPARYMPWVYFCYTSPWGSGCWSSKPYGHRTFLSGVPWELWAFPTNYATRKPSFNRNFAIDLLTKWKTGDILQGFVQVFVFFTDGSEMVVESVRCFFSDLLV